MSGSNSAAAGPAARSRSRRGPGNPRYRVAQVSRIQLELFRADHGEAAPRAAAAGAAKALAAASTPAGGLRLAVLGSGSSGNAVVVESAHGRLLIDAGFSCRELERRLRLVGVEPGEIDALVLTHEHSDHCRGARTLARRFGLPVYATPGTLADGLLGPGLDALCHPFRPDHPFEVAGFEVEPFVVPHDAREPVGLVVRDAAGCRIGLAGDLGCRSRLAWARLLGVHALLLETNHDLEMLRRGPYPWSLKQRVAGRHGHLSNADAAAGLAELTHDDLQWVVLYHLSRTNNLPALAEAVVAEELTRAGSPARVVVSDQHEPSPWLEIAGVARASV
jgi:phosphoribosyl 1,2-cyclic phosphodiesterase